VVALGSRSAGQGADLDQVVGQDAEDDDNGFAHSGWLAPYPDEDFGRIMTGVFEHAGAFLLGRRTYEIFAA
jgi:hypothetical protein